MSDTDNSDASDEGAALLRRPALRKAEPALSLLTMSALAYFSVCGGPFGLELAVGAAGPWRLVYSLLSLALFWALPCALMTAELSSALPSTGGYMHWVRLFLLRCQLPRPPPWSIFRAVCRSVEPLALVAGP